MGSNGWGSPSGGDGYWDPEPSAPVAGGWGSAPAPASAPVPAAEPGETRASSWGAAPASTPSPSPVSGSACGPASAALTPTGAPAFAPAPTAWGTPAPDGSAWAAPARPSAGHAVGHFFKWLLAVVAVFAVSLGIMLGVSWASGYVFTLWYQATEGSLAGVYEAFDKLDPMPIQIAMQLISLAVMLLWWARAGRQSFLSQRRLSAARPAVGREVVAFGGVLVLGFGVQLLLSLLLTVAFALFPQVGSDYRSMMDSSGLNDFATLSIIAVTILAPLEEELTCRALMLEFSLRAVNPRWSKWGRAVGLPVGAVRFWCANLIQALAFGILHMNIVQGTYAFALGLALGAIVWRTGRLRYSIGLHLAVNLSSFAIDPLAPLLGTMPFLVYLLFVLLLVVAGALLVWRFAPSSAVSAAVPVARASAPAPAPGNADYWSEAPRV